MPFSTRPRTHGGTPAYLKYWYSKAKAFVGQSMHDVWETLKIYSALVILKRYSARVALEIVHHPVKKHEFETMPFFLSYEQNDMLHLYAIHIELGFSQIEYVP